MMGVMSVERWKCLLHFTLLVVHLIVDGDVTTCGARIFLKVKEQVRT